MWKVGQYYFKASHPVRLREIIEVLPTDTYRIKDVLIGDTYTTFEHKHLVEIGYELLTVLKLTKLRLNNKVSIETYSTLLPLVDETDEQESS